VHFSKELPEEKYIVYEIISVHIGLCRILVFVYQIIAVLYFSKIQITCNVLFQLAAFSSFSSQLSLIRMSH
jgi:hypothetical protein